MRRNRFKEAAGVLLAIPLLAISEASARGPSDRKLRKRATSPEAESRRAVAQERIDDLTARLSTVEGLEHVLTTFTDSCNRPYRGASFGARPTDVLRCGMRSVSYFGVQGDITDVLARIREADIAAWGPRDGQGQDQPGSSGTITYAIDYHRHRGRYPDGGTMPAPVLKTTSLEIDWDRLDFPLVNRIEEANLPAPEAAGGGIYRRCSTVPQTPTSVAEARAHYGTVLRFVASSTDTSRRTYYHAVPRGS
ncbi:hypothetical protein [Kitasatospora sp. MBT66]|uniref:hypothetical protein n=1 Tax=Kitasatospora sp. MBT66 TaxID=1444769 RepID=UPI0005B794B2|nr:hypothetical protein [Kitasatospora sp. MBT66]